MLTLAPLLYVKSIFGNSFDIHGGGMDLKFPHHECEIAQGKGSNGVSPVKYWMHANMLTMNGQRMSKSTGNYILPQQLISGENDFFEKPFHPEIGSNIRRLFICFIITLQKYIVW